MKLLSRAGAALLLALALSVAPLAATTWIVNTTADDTTTPSLCSLRDAIRAARDNTPVNNCSPGGSSVNTDVIQLPNGVYTFGGSSETVTGGGPLTIEPSSASPAVTVTAGAGPLGFLDVANMASAVTLRKFTISGFSFGAVHFANSSGPTLIDGMQFLSNSSTFAGGALQWGGTGTLQILNSIFTENTSTSFGGAVLVQGPGMVLLRDVLFTSNLVTATSGGQPEVGGGALSVGGYGQTVCLRCTFDGNGATVLASGGTVEGGTLYVLTQSFASFTMLDSSITNSSGSGGSSITGALWAWAQSSSTVNIDRVRIDTTTIDTGTPGESVRLRAFTGATVAFTDSQVTYDNLHDSNGLYALADGSGSKVDIGQSTIADFGLVAAVLAASNGGAVRLQNSLLTSVTDSTTTAGVTKSGNCERPNNYGGFVNHGAGNYRLKVPVPVGVTSAIDVGADNQPTQRDFDLDHYKRVVGIHPDCGAYESSSLFADGLELGELGSWSGVR